MPNRVIKESICTSDNLDSLSWFEEVFFYRLIVNCDDYGRMDARPAIIRSRLFPLKTITDKQVESALQSLRSAAMIDLYEVDGHSFLQMRTWERHQTIRAKRSKYPAPESGVMESESKCNQMISNESKCSRNPIQSESNPNPNPNPNPKSTRASAFVPPTLEEVEAYCRERNSPVDPKKFFEYFDAGDWKDAKGQKVKNWKQKLLTWEKFDTTTKSSNPFLEMLKEDDYEPFGN